MTVTKPLRQLAMCFSSGWTRSYTALLDGVGGQEEWTPGLSLLASVHPLLALLKFPWSLFSVVSMYSGELNCT